MHKCSIYHATDPRTNSRSHKHDSVTHRHIFITALHPFWQLAQAKRCIRRAREERVGGAHDALHVAHCTARHKLRGTQGDFHDMIDASSMRRAESRTCQRLPHVPHGQSTPLTHLIPRSRPFQTAPQLFAHCALLPKVWQQKQFYRSAAHRGGDATPRIHITCRFHEDIDSPTPYRARIHSTFRATRRCASHQTPMHITRFHLKALNTSDATHPCT